MGLRVPQLSEEDGGRGVASMLTAQGGPRENEGPMSSKAPVSLAARERLRDHQAAAAKVVGAHSAALVSTQGSDLSPSRGARRPGWPGGRRQRRSRRRRRDGGQSVRRRCGRDPARRQQGGGSPCDESCAASRHLRDRACLRSRRRIELSNRRPVLSWGRRVPRTAESFFALVGK